MNGFFHMRVVTYNIKTHNFKATLFHAPGQIGLQITRYEAPTGFSQMFNNEDFSHVNPDPLCSRGGGRRRKRPFDASLYPCAISINPTCNPIQLWSSSFHSSLLHSLPHFVRGRVLTVIIYHLKRRCRRRKGRRRRERYIVLPTIQPTVERLKGLLCTLRSRK
jgi:hypothetical protein